MKFKIQIVRKTIGGHKPVKGHSWIQETKQTFYPEKGEKVICREPHKTARQGRIIDIINFDEEGTNGTLEVALI